MKIKNQICLLTCVFLIFCLVSSCSESLSTFGDEPNNVLVDKKPAVMNEKRGKNNRNEGIIPTNEEMINIGESHNESAILVKGTTAKNSRE